MIRSALNRILTASMIGGLLALTVTVGMATPSAPVAPAANPVAPAPTGLACWTEHKTGGLPDERICGDISLMPAGSTGVGPYNA